MEKDVIISINGLHNAGNEEDNVEMIAPGNYYNKNGKHYIIYSEISGDNGDINKNTIKISNNVIDIIRKGSSNVHMVFEEGKKHTSYYNTPFGNMLIGLSAKHIEVSDKSDEMNINIDYSIEVNYEHLSDCIMNINIKSKEGANITLM